MHWCYMLTAASCSANSLHIARLVSDCTHTHTHIYIYIYIYICVCVYVCISGFVHKVVNWYTYIYSGYICIY